MQSLEKTMTSMVKITMMKMRRVMMVHSAREATTTNRETRQLARDRSERPLYLYISIIHTAN